MEPINKLQPGTVPTLTKVWEHNDEILGINENGDLVVVARLLGNEGAHGKREPSAPRVRIPRAKKKDAVPAETEAEHIASVKSS
jgi:hypothetical protein